MKLKKCERCERPTVEGLPLCPECMEAAGVSAVEVEAAKELRDITRVLLITSSKDSNIKEAITGILNTADRIENNF